MRVSRICASLAPLVLSASVAPASTFFVEQYDADFGGNLDAYRTYAATNPADYSAYVPVIDFTDDPSGFTGDFSGAMPWPSTVETGATGTGHALNTTFFARITASFNVAAADTFTFRTYNDDGVFLLIDDQLVINDPNLHPERLFTGSIDLEVGAHDLVLYFFENRGEASLELSFTDSSTNAYAQAATSNAVISAVPLPGTAALLLSGLFGLGAMYRRRSA